MGSTLDWLFSRDLIEIMDITDIANESEIESIQSIAVRIVEDQMKQQSEDDDPKERTIFILGSRNVGKTTIVHKFFDNEDPVKPTLALDYTFRRRSNNDGNQKQILNVWELGNLENSKGIIEVPMKSHNLGNFTCTIVLDMSRPQDLWNDLKTAVDGLKENYEKLATTDKTKEEKTKRIKKEHPDYESLTSVMPLPLIIVGGKYDLFQNFDPEVKKQVCRCLRITSHFLGAALIFYSSKIGILSKTLRDVLSHLGFGRPSNPVRRTVLDYNEPIMCWFGQDSWENIGIREPIKSLKEIESYFSSRIIPDRNKPEKIIEDPGKDPGFKESLIDEMRAQKEEDLIILSKEADIKSKFETVPS